MKRELVFVHGRAQEFKSADKLKATWIETWIRGLGKSGLAMPVSENSIRFPYYGQTLSDLVHGKSPDEIADVIVRGTDLDPGQRQFIFEVLEEVLAAEGVTDEQRREAE